VQLGASPNRCCVWPLQVSQPSAQWWNGGESTVLSCHYPQLCEKCHWYSRSKSTWSLSFFLANDLMLRWNHGCMPPSWEGSSSCRWFLKIHVTHGWASPHSAPHWLVILPQWIHCHGLWQHISWGKKPVLRLPSEQAKSSIDLWNCSKSETCSMSWEVVVLWRSPYWSPRLPYAVWCWVDEGWMEKGGGN